MPFSDIFYMMLGTNFMITITKIFW